MDVVKFLDRSVNQIHAGLVHNVSLALMVTAHAFALKEWAGTQHQLKDAIATNASLMKTVHLTKLVWDTNVETHAQALAALELSVVVKPIIPYAFAIMGLQETLFKNVIHWLTRWSLLIHVSLVHVALTQNVKY